jgi:comEA protein
MKSDLLRRRLYLFSERIGIRQSELALLLVLAVIALTAGLVNGFWPKPESPFSADDYAELRKEFHERAQRALHDDSIRTAKFHHPEAFLAAEAKKDSTVENTGKAAKKGGKSFSPVNINVASLAELEQIPGVGPKTAVAILELRQKIGPFTSVEQLTAVKGIGPKKLEKLKPHVTL